MSDNSEFDIDWRDITVTEHIKAKISYYFIELGSAASQFLNAIFAGNRDQTFSSRLGEAVSLGKRRWYPAYWLVNGGAYVIRWVIGRVLGYRFGLDMPTNHCMWAFLTGDSERTYL